MSQVRMCDVCGKVFSVRDTDWQTLTMQSNNPSDPMYGKTVSIDVCGNCGFTPPNPKMEIEPGSLYTPKKGGDAAGWF